jgi:hypothetical protein
MPGKIRGNRGKRVNEVIYRALGYLFFVLFAFSLVFMLVKAERFRTEFLAWETIYIVVTLLLLSFIMIKMIFAKYHAGFCTKLMLRGTALFGLTFGLAGVAVGYYASIRSGLPYSDLFMVNKKLVNVESVKILMNRKCGKCHSLERVYLVYKSDAAWNETVNKMAEFDYPHISGTDVRQIVAYLIQQQRRRWSNADRLKTGKSLVSRKCGICHDLERVFSVDKSRRKWTDTINNMVEILGVSDFLSEQEEDDIVSFLSSRKKIKKKKVARAGSDKARLLVARKCNAGCHALDRVFRGDKNKQEWSETIDNMVEMTGNPNFLSAKEKKDIIDCLSPQEQDDQQRDSVNSKLSETAHTLISRKCTICHDLERLFSRQEKEKAIEK